MSFTIVSDTLPRFPTDISFEHEGGAVYDTDVQVLESGNEQRNAFWDEPLFKWEVGYGPRDIAKIEALRDFFHAVKGRWRTFRFKDWQDYKSGVLEESPSFDDQALGAAAVGQTVFQLVKTYSEAIYSTAIRVTRPIGNTIRIGVAGTEETSGWTVDETTGLITRGTPLSGGEAVTWGGEFDRAVRFDEDAWKQSFRAWTVAGVTVVLTSIRE